jgi:hypothetical protein
LFQVPENLRPSLLRLPIASPQGQDPLAPIAHAAITVSIAAFSFSNPALTEMPSTQRYTTWRAPSLYVDHSSYSACHFSFSRPTVFAEMGAASPRSPRSARSKSPWGEPVEIQLRQ